jgi:hypothetical protein
VELTYDQIPSLYEVRRTTADALRAPFRRSVGRRSFLRGASAAGAAMVVGTQFLGAVARMSPAAAAATCSTAGLTYRANCLGDRYASCSGGRLGCARPTSVSNGGFCRTALPNSRHRTCGEPRNVNGTIKYYQLRTNQCYDGVSDGWTWTDPRNWPCGGCGSRFFRSYCNDGYYRMATAAAYAPSICESSVCV